MRVIFLILTLFFICGTAVAQEYRFISATTGKDIPPTKLAKQLRKYDVVFFGEYHDDASIHLAQRQLLPHMYARNKRLLVSFEMFERDVQPVLDAYLKDEITEESFLAGSRPWPNYASDYRPLLEFAKSKGLACIAANVPRYLAGKAVRNGLGFLTDLPDSEKILVALKINAPAGKYRDNFLQTIAGNMAHGDMGNPDFYQNMYYAQCIKDDTMAESLVQYLERNPRHRIVHFNGDFHSREFLGTVERVKLRNPKLKIAVISPLHQSEPFPQQANKIATYFIIVPDPPTPEIFPEGN